jgi:O-antigen/teichoic acid export membrane protein
VPSVAREPGPATTPAADSIGYNAAFSLASQLTSALLTAGLTIFLVRALETAEYGVFALALGINSILLLLADFGISSSTARFMAERRTRPSALGPLFADALKLKLVVAGLAAALVFLGAGLIADLYGDEELAWPLRGMALAAFGQSVVLMAFAVFTALGKIVIRYRLVLGESVVEVTASVLLVLLGAGATGAAFGRAIGFLVGGGLGIVLVLRLLGGPRPSGWRRPSPETIRNVGRYASSLLVVDAAYTLSGSANVLLLGAYLGNVATAIYAAPARLMILLQYPGLALANAVGPRLARGEGQTPDVPALATALRALVFFQCMLLAPVLVWAEPIVDTVLGSDYAESADVLVALLPYLLFSGLAPAVTIGINYLGEARRRVPIAVLSLVLWVGSAMLLIPAHGPVGAAVAADLGIAFYTLLHLWVCRRLLGLSLARLAGSLARGLLAAAVMAGVLRLFGTADISALPLAAAAPLGATAYLAVVVATRGVTLDELRRMPHALRRRPTSVAPRPGAPK